MVMFFLSAILNLKNPTCEADDPPMDPTSSFCQRDPLREQESVLPPTPEPRRTARQRKPPNHLTY